MSATQQTHKSLRELVGPYKFVAFTTIGANGMPNTRPMATQEAEPDMDLWFAARLDSEKVEELRKNPKVGLYYLNPENWHYVSVGGTVEIIQDQERFKRYWEDSWRQWFPQGPDDPEAVLLKVDAQIVTYAEDDEPVTFTPQAK